MQEGVSRGQSQKPLFVCPLQWPPILLDWLGHGDGGGRHGAIEMHAMESTWDHKESCLTTTNAILRVTPSPAAAPARPHPKGGDHAHAGDP